MKRSSIVFLTLPLAACTITTVQPKPPLCSLVQINKENCIDTESKQNLPNYTVSHFQYLNDMIGSSNLQPNFHSLNNQTYYPPARIVARSATLPSIRGGFGSVGRGISIGT